MIYDVNRNGELFSEVRILSLRLEEKLERQRVLLCLVSWRHVHPERANFVALQLKAQAFVIAAILSRHEHGVWAPRMLRVVRDGEDKSASLAPVEARFLVVLGDYFVLIVLN